MKKKKKIENTNFLLKDVDLILIFFFKSDFNLKKKCKSDFLFKNKVDFYLEKM